MNGAHLRFQINADAAGIYDILAGYQYDIAGGKSLHVFIVEANIIRSQFFISLAELHIASGNIYLGFLVIGQLIGFQPPGQIRKLGHQIFRFYSAGLCCAGQRMCHKQ